jgi:hypothetical protein
MSDDDRSVWMLAFIPHHANVLDGSGKFLMQYRFLNELSD